MDAPKYPKVETLFERGDGWRETGELPLVNFGGRTDRAQMRADLLEVLSASFTRADFLGRDGR